MKIKQKELDRAVTHSTLATSSPLMNSMQARNKKQNRVTLAPSINQGGIGMDRLREPVATDQMNEGGPRASGCSGSLILDPGK